jgi:hypothetical protein
LFLGKPPIVPIPGCKGFRMNIGGHMVNTVVFIGHEDHTAPGGIKCFGTGFLLGYESKGYLVTAAHVARQIDGVPFAIRMNRVFEPISDLVAADQIEWHYHLDKAVDIALIEFTATRELGFSPLYIHQDKLIPKDPSKPPFFDIGDLCYTVGMFHFLSGRNRNLPLVYTGNIALMADAHETVQIGNDNGGIDQIEAYLIQSGAIKGASGSPVFVWSSMALQSIVEPHFPVPRVAHDNTFLLGVYTGAWFMPPDSIVRQAVQARERDVVPVGLGVVVPSYKILEILESDPVKKERNKMLRDHAAQQTAIRPEISPVDKNPNHREDFTSLLNAAAKKKPQDDQT